MHILIGSFKNQSENIDEEDNVSTKLESLYEIRLLSKLDTCLATLEGIL